MLLWLTDWIKRIELDASELLQKEIALYLAWKTWDPQQKDPLHSILTTKVEELDICSSREWFDLAVQ